MSHDIIKLIKQALDDEISSLAHFRENLDPSVKDCVELILQSKGKVIVTGVASPVILQKRFRIPYPLLERLHIFYTLLMQATEIQELLAQRMSYLRSERVANPKS